MIVSYYDAVKEIVGIDNMIGGNINGPISEIEFVKGFTNLPTEEQIQSKMSELQVDYDSKQYQRDRAVEYPSINDQLDEIFHKGLTEWKKTIQAVKDKHPKPTE